MQSIDLLRDNLTRSTERVLARVEEMRPHALVPVTSRGGPHTLWLLGHLPWGRDPFLGGSLAWAGESLRAWLPGPRALEGWLGGLGYTSAAVAGLLLLALAFVRPAEPRA